MTEEVALFADGAVDWEEPQAARPVMRAKEATTTEIRLNGLLFIHEPRFFLFRLTLATVALSGHLYLVSRDSSPPTGARK